MISGYFLWLWITVIPCDISGGQRCEAVLRESKANFGTKAECLEARREAIAELTANPDGYRRVKGVCLRYTMPFLEPQVSNDVPKRQN